MSSVAEDDFEVGVVDLEQINFPYFLCGTLPKRKQKQKQIQIKQIHVDRLNIN